jgi:hypothetical protein
MRLLLKLGWLQQIYSKQQWVVHDALPLIAAVGDPPEKEGVAKDANVATLPEPKVVVADANVAALPEPKEVVAEDANVAASPEPKNGR